MTYTEGSLYALLSVVATALLRLTLKHCATTSSSAWATLTLYHLGGFLVLLPFLGAPDLSVLSQTQIGLLLVTGALFSVAGVLDIIAMRQLDASAGEIFSVGGLLFFSVGGYFFFSVGGLLPPPPTATPPSLPRIAPHAKEDEIPPSRERVVLHV
jgi:hypothetical protein